MRVALLSDVHGNLPALEAVIADVERTAVDAVWVLGDTVGYGADPNAVVERLQQLGALAVLGNHDAAAVGRAGTDGFNPVAAAAVRWTAAVLAEEAAAWLAGLPEVRREGEVLLCHGTLRDPLWEYLFSEEAAHAHFALQTTPVSVVGHTHVPLVLTDDGARVAGRRPPVGERLDLPRSGRICLNPGSVGQPRDGDPRAAYALLDLSEGWFELRRVPYPVAVAQARVRAAGLPEVLAARLALGR